MIGHNRRSRLPPFLAYYSIIFFVISKINKIQLHTQAQQNTWTDRTTR